MKVILIEKISNLGNIGDVVDVSMGYARNYLLPNNKVLRHTVKNLAVFESQKADLEAKQVTAKSTAEATAKKLASAKIQMIRQAGDTGQLYGSVSTRDVARNLSEQGIDVISSQILLGAPIKSVGVFNTKVELHADVIVPVSIFVAQTPEEIAELVRDPEYFAKKSAAAKKRGVDENESGNSEVAAEKAESEEPTNEQGE